MSIFERSRHSKLSDEEWSNIIRLQEVAGGDMDMYCSLAIANCVVSQIERGVVKLTPSNQGNYDRCKKLLSEKGLYPPVNTERV